MARFTPLLLLIALPWLPLAAHAQAVHRCIGPDGGSIFSDQPCHSLGAVARQAPLRPAAASAHGFTTGTGTVAPGCARSLDALLTGVRGALDSRDVNRLATHYHWAGTSARGGRYLMDQLEAIATRPVVAIDFVFAEPAPDPDGAFAAEPETPPATPRPQRPQALRIEQGSGPSGVGAMRTDFLLRRHAGCWWVEL